MKQLVPFLKNIIPFPALLPEVDVSPRPDLSGTAQGLWIEPDTLITLVNGWQIAEWAIETIYRWQPALRPGNTTGQVSCRSSVVPNSPGRSASWSVFGYKIPILAESVGPPAMSTYLDDYSVIGGANLTSTATWYHMAAVFNADTQALKLYLNGNLDADKTVSYNTVFQSTAPFMLGANLSDGAAAQTFDGLLDDWRVYTRALSQSEIQTLMSQ